MEGRNSSILKIRDKDLTVDELEDESSSETLKSAQHFSTSSPVCLPQEQIIAVQRYEESQFEQCMSKEVAVPKCNADILVVDSDGAETIQIITETVPKHDPEVAALDELSEYLQSVEIENKYQLDLANNQLQACSDNANAILYQKGRIVTQLKKGE